jgi:YtkA-like
MRLMPTVATSLPTSIAASIAAAATRFATLVPTLVLPLVLLAACGGDEDHSGNEQVNCATETRADNLVSGLEKLGDRGQVTFRLMTATPSPPKRPTNSWMVHVEAGGAPVTGAVLRAKPYMPDHEHGTGVKPVITEVAGAPGDYQVDQLDLWMPGLWEITFDITPPGGVKDQTVFRACLPE